MKFLTGNLLLEVEHTGHRGHAGGAVRAKLCQCYIFNISKTKREKDTIMNKRDMMPVFSAVVDAVW